MKKNNICISILRWLFFSPGIYIMDSKKEWSEILAIKSQKFMAIEFWGYYLDHFVFEYPLFQISYENVITR